MSDDKTRAEIIANGLVQGVGFRYFITRNAEDLNLKGFTQNLPTGEVLTVVEGDKSSIEELFNKIKVGPRSASVNNCNIRWKENKNEFESFFVKH